MGWFNYDETDIPRRYDASRAFLPETLAQWLKAVSAHVQSGVVRTIIDVGCGTGRFTQALADHFHALVIGIDPAEKMLKEAVGTLGSGLVCLVRGSADHLPVRDGSIDLVFMSQVYHHLGDKPRAAREFRRILNRTGRLCVRTSTREILPGCLYFRFWPEALALASTRLPSRDEVKSVFQEQGFELAAEQAITQLWARDLQEYYQKLSLRATSDLALITDEQFERGLARFKGYCDAHDTGAPVYDDIDLFVFRPG